MEIRNLTRDGIQLWLLSVDDYLDKHDDVDMEAISEWSFQEFGYDPYLFGGAWLFSKEVDAITFKLRWS